MAREGGCSECAEGHGKDLAFRMSGLKVWCELAQTQSTSGRYKALPENYVIFEDCDKNKNNKKSQKFEFFLVPNVKKKLLGLSSLTEFPYNLNF